MGPKAPDSIFAPSDSQHSQSINEQSRGPQSVSHVLFRIDAILKYIVAAQSEALNEMSFSNRSRMKMSSKKKSSRGIWSRKIVAILTYANIKAVSSEENSSALVSGS